VLNFPKVAAPRGMTRCDEPTTVWVFLRFEGNPKISNGGWFARETERTGHSAQR